jgi:hypothetical protein
MTTNVTKSTTMGTGVSAGINKVYAQRLQGRKPTTRYAFRETGQNARL